MEGLDSRYKGVLTEEQHALLGELYTATFPPAGSGSERPALQSYIANPSASIPLSGYDHNYDLDSTSDPASPPSESSSSNILIYALPDGIGNWPQRLLHVPSMTSFEWEPGNRYGVHIAPLYNALSYTWGRYDIDNAFSEKKVNKRVLRQTKALPIRFEGRPREATEVGWAKEVPRIDPEHFTVSEFGNVIRQVCESDESAKVEFLWVDVACIDQRDGPQKDAEIGRQAVLFRGAKAVFIWLTRLRSVELNGILRELSEGTATAHAISQMNDDLLRQNPGRDFHWILQCRNALDKLFMDPWFTSLWTLQEAFLCPHAYLLPREAEHIPMIQSMLLRISNTGSLSGLSAICDLLQKACEKVYTTMLIVDDFLVHRSNLTDIQTMLRDRGLSALVTGNPIALYGVASFRRTRKDVDRVYGIEQVFELRLGASASGSQSSRTYTRLRLETQLGAKILEKLPVLSQIHNFNEPVELGRGWRISSASRIPAIDLHINIASAKHTPACQLSVSRIARGEMGTYKGMITSFNQLRLAWSQAPLASGVQESDGSRSLQQICLDVFLNHKKFEFSHIPSEELGPEGFEVTYPAVWGFQRDIRRGIEQHELAAWLTTRLEELHQGKALVVLLLGSFSVRKTELHGAEAYNVGLILLESELHGTSYWRRLGFCLWQYDLVGLNSEAANILRAVEGQGNWKYTEGLFG